MGSENPASIRLHVWGDRACFPRSEIKYERVTYDVMTPAAARGLVSSIHSPSAIRWHIDRIHILRPIQFQEVAWSDPLATGINRNIRPGTTPRAAIILVDVAYLIEAHFTLAPSAGPDETVAKHANMFNRRARKLQPTRAPCLGLAALPAEYELIEMGNEPISTFPQGGSLDLGWMLHDFDHGAGSVSRYFRARIENGAIDVPPNDDPGLAA